MRFTKMLAATAAGATITAGLLVGAGPASADERVASCEILLSSSGSSSCGRIQWYYSHGDRIGRTTSFWFEGKRVRVSGHDCTTYSSGGRIQGTTCKKWSNA